MAKKTKEKKPTNNTGKKKRIIKYFLIILVIVLIAFMTYRYTEEAKETSYIKGGQDAIEMITGAVTNSGGISITNENDTIVLSKYDKPTPNTQTPITEKITPEETTNQTE